MFIFLYHTGLQVAINTYTYSYKHYDIDMQ